MDSHFITRTNTILYCRRWAETVHFYREVLGLPVTIENDWFVEFRLTEASFLSIADTARASVAAVEGQGITLAWQVDDLDAARKHLQQQGIAVTPIRRRWDARVFYCHDPEGHRLEFWNEG
jgi:catechol 2,3-dioxygenase-like lactoylglutathione lyase family enzyme